MERRFWIVGGLVLALALTFACGPTGDQERSATVIEAVNKVDAHSRPQDDWQPAEVDMAIYGGGRVRTGAASSAQLELLEGIVRLSAQSMFTVKESATRQGKLETRLFLQEGRLWAHLTSDDPHEFTVETGNAAAAVRDTHFSVRVIGGGTFLSVAAGQAVLTALGQSVTVTAGQQAMVELGQPPGPPEPMSREELTLWAAEAELMGIEEFDLVIPTVTPEPPTPTKMPTSTATPSMKPTPRPTKTPTSTPRPTKTTTRTPQPTKTPTRAPTRTPTPQAATTPTPVPPTKPPSGCSLPTVVEFYAAPPPQGSTARFTLHWTIQGADRAEIFGHAVDPNSGTFDVWDDEANYWVLWAKVNDTPDDCYAENAIHVDPDAIGSPTGFSDVTVSQRNIEISVRDNAAIDGDRIDLFVNGVKVLSDYTLTSSPHPVAVTLNSGENTVKVTALNEGRDSPNTVEVKVSHVTSGSAVQVSQGLRTGQSASFKIHAP